jgi:A/G-specific adenine glycosylase
LFLKFQNANINGFPFKKKLKGLFLYNFLKMTHFNIKICDWYLQNHRQLPWRETSDPYRIWISEIILQQTRVKQGHDYYLRFIGAFPTVETLARASEQNVLRAWQGLGYYTRARNLHRAARVIVNDLGGQMPRNSHDLRKLSGIGPYTAAAIASIAFREPVAVVDGNVYRLLSRCFAISTPIDSTEGKKSFGALANRLIDTLEPGRFNQAMMELGALICTPTNPQCHLCPVEADCLSLKTGTHLQYPVKGKKIAKRTRHFNYVLLRSAVTCFATKRREKDDIWQGLFEPLLIESDGNSSVKKD